MAGRTYRWKNKPDAELKISISCFRSSCSLADTFLSSLAALRHLSTEGRSQVSKVALREKVRDKSTLGVPLGEQ
jgi:hypothetical protein